MVRTKPPGLIYHPIYSQLELPFKHRYPIGKYQALYQALLELAVKLITANNGRCFFLFTSHRMLQLVAKQLPDLIRQPVLVQGSIGKRLLLDQFVKLDNAVLLGTGVWAAFLMGGLHLWLVGVMPFTRAV